MGREKLSIKTQANKQRNKNQNNYYKKKERKEKYRISSKQTQGIKTAGVNWGAQ